MHKFVSFNHRITLAENAFLPAISSAAFYGKGVFTTVAIYNSKSFLWEKHWQRLNTNAKKIGVDLSEFTSETVEKSLSEIIEKNKIANARARITFFDQSPNKIWQIESKRRTDFLIVTADFRGVSENFCLTVSPFRVNSTSPLTGVKSCNYLENILVLEDAKAKGFDEAVRLNEREEVVSVSTANIFWIKNREIFTPNLETGCLNGTTRNFLLESFSVKETKANLAEIKNADEVFLTSAGIGVAKVKSIDEQILKGEIANQIQIKFSRQCNLASNKMNPQLKSKRERHSQKPTNER